MAAATVGLVAVGAAVAPTAGAVSPHNAGLSAWTDCGPKVCTKYWSVEKTQDLYKNMDSWQWSFARVVHAGTNLVLAVVTQSSQANADGFESSLNEAYTHGGCLQYAWRVDGKGRGLYGATTHSDYCGSQKERYDRVGNTSIG